MNNLNYTEEQLFELYGKMPEDIQSIIRDENLGPAIQIIGKDHGITPSQALDVEDMVLHILLGTIPVHNFTKKIKEKLGASEDVAQKITKDIDENIFSQVKESLDKISIPTKPDGIIKIPLVLSTNPPSSVTDDKEIPKVPQAPLEEKSESIQAPVLPSKIVKKKPMPYEEVSTQTTAPTPLTQQTIHKPIIGAEKIGIGIPPPEKSTEHMFEQKLKERTQPDTQKTIPTTTPPPTEIKTEQEVRAQRKPLVETPSYGADPYRETATDDTQITTGDL